VGDEPRDFLRHRSRQHTWVRGHTAKDRRRSVLIFAILRAYSVVRGLPVIGAARR
jgi:hypothetical protein